MGNPQPIEKDSVIVRTNEVVDYYLRDDETIITRQDGRNWHELTSWEKNDEGYWTPSIVEYGVQIHSYETHRLKAGEVPSDHIKAMSHKGHTTLIPAEPKEPTVIEP